MKVVLLLLLLGVGVSTGFFETKRTVNYGDKVHFYLGYLGRALKFYPVDGGEKILWRRYESQNNTTQRGMQVGGDYVIYNVTQKDSGTYKVMDRNDFGQKIYTLKVEAVSMFSILSVNGSSQYPSQLDQNACNINFIPLKSGQDPSGVVLVRNGQLQRGSAESFCEAFEYKAPCQMSMKDATTSCNGRYEIKDDLGNLAYFMELQVLGNIIHLVKDFDDTLKMLLDSRAFSIWFYSRGGKKFLLWSASDSEIPTKYRGAKTGRHYEIDNLTYKDVGTYVVRDKAGRHVIAYSLRVQAKNLSLDSNVEERFEYSFYLKEDDCSITFILKEDDREVGTLNLVDKGKRQSDIYSSDCANLEYEKPCQIYMTSSVTSCSGRFEVKDSNGNLAYSLELSIVSPFNVSAFVISIIVIGPILLACIKFCCCTKPPKKNAADAEDADSQNSNEPEREPVALSNDTRPSETPYSVQPYSSMTPLMHNTTLDAPPAYSEIFNPTVDTPPAYSEVSAPADQTYSSAATVSCDPSAPPLCDSTVPFSGGPTAPLSSVDEPRFEVEGVNFSIASPLRSDSTDTGVYISDHLNFL